MYMLFYLLVNDLCLTTNKLFLTFNYCICLQRGIYDLLISRYVFIQAHICISSAVKATKVAKCGPNSKMHAVFNVEQSWLSNVFRALLPKENITDIL